MFEWKKAKLINWSWVSFAFNFFLLDAYVSHAQADGLLQLELKSSWSDRKLETREVRSIDPMVLNPFFSRWVLKRPVELQVLDVSSTKTKKGARRPSTEARLQSAILKTQTVMFKRTEMAVEHTDIKTAFPCTHSQQIDFDFSTPIGIQYAAEVARDEWHALLQKNAKKLETKLATLRHEKQEAVHAGAQKIFQEWLENLDFEWAASSEKLVRRKEWLFYAKEAGCTTVLSTPEKNFTFQERHRKNLPFSEQPLKSGETPSRRLNSDALARVPAKLWEGLYSVRMSVDVGDKLLNGQFLIDSTTQESLMSSSFLRWQGMNPVFLTEFGRRKHLVEWISGSGESIPLYVFGVRIGTHTLPLHEFYLADTELFGPPDYKKSCCDGVLGLDFLRHYRVEWLDEPSKAIRIWDQTVSIDDGTWLWVPVYFDQERKKPTSDCVLHATDADASSSKEPAKAKLQGVRWSSASATSVDIHKPWQSTVAKLARGHRVQWNLECPTDVPNMTKSPIASQLIPSIPEGGGKRHASAYPSSTVGIEILGRGPVMWDLPNGRIGFNKETLKTPVWQNRSGLELEFSFNDQGDRVLKVSEIHLKTSAALLKKEGLQVGSEITLLDGIPADDLDKNAVDRLLRGQGWSLQLDKSHLSLEWRVKKKKSGNLQVRF